MQTRQPGRIRILAFNASLSVALAGTLIVCSDASDPHSDHGEVTTLSVGSTQLSRGHGVQAAFDIMNVAGHMRMAEMMQIEHSQKAGTDRHLSFTLMDQQAKQIIIDAQDLRIQIITPDGTELSDSGHVMSGGGMHHHGFDFAYAGPGTYKIQLTFNWQDRAHGQTARFEH